jgi:hypothetical protein
MINGISSAESAPSADYPPSSRCRCIRREDFDPQMTQISQIKNQEDQQMLGSESRALSVCIRGSFAVFLLHYGRVNGVGWHVPEGAMGVAKSLMCQHALRSTSGTCDPSQASAFPPKSGGMESRRFCQGHGLIETRFHRFRFVGLLEVFRAAKDQGGANPKIHPASIKSFRKDLCHQTG